MLTDAQEITMGEIDNSTKPTMQDNVNELQKNMSEVGNHLLKAAGNWVSIAWQEKEMEADAAIAAGKYIAEHPTEVTATLAAGPIGLAAVKAGQELYSENKEDVIDPALDNAAKAGQALYSEASGWQQIHPNNYRTITKQNPLQQ